MRVEACRGVRKVDFVRDRSYTCLIRYTRRRAVFSETLVQQCTGVLLFVRPYMFNVAVLIDGGFLRALTTQAKKVYSTDLIEVFAHSCVLSDERLFRAL